MGVLLINIITKNNRVEKNIIKKLQWYDADKKEMLEFEGGELKFEYDPINKKTIVGVKELKCFVYEKNDNSAKILEWVSKNSEDFNLSVVNKDQFTYSVAFDDEFLEDVEYSLYDNKLEYSIL